MYSTGNNFLTVLVAQGCNVMFNVLYSIQFFIVYVITVLVVFTLSIFCNMTKRFYNCEHVKIM